jgi:DNA-binding Lrp family transcriptional regulator
MELDSKDIQLLEILEGNAKTPVQEIAEKTGIPASTVHHRIKKLEGNKIIKGYTAILNPKVMGKGFSAYVMVNGSPEKYLDNDFFEHRYVAEVSAVTGNYDLIIKIQCSNLDQFNDFLQEFREKYGKYLTQTVTMVCTETLV